LTRNILSAAWDNILSAARRSVLLVGAALGVVRGGSASLLYVFVGILGAPIYAGGTHGWAVITGASGGTSSATRSCPR
jgi:biotin transporter BioY